MPRRRGSALMLVVTLLGILFVMGIAFMGAMSFEAESVAIDQRRTAGGSDVDGVLDAVGVALRGLPLAGIAGDGVAYAGLAGVDGMAASVEPYTPDPLMPLAVVFPNFTNPRRWDGAAPAPLPDLPICTGFPAGVPVDRFSCAVDVNNGDVQVDADGDGIADTVALAASELGMTGDLFELKRLLNPPSAPDAEPSIGLRVISHGAMVNLNESHPLMIDNVLDRDAYNPGNHNPPYSPYEEERWLRRRMLLPAEAMGPTALHGNPMLDPNQFPFGDGDLAAVIFPPGDTVFSHRYWRFDHDELLTDDENAPLLWTGRMDAIASYHWNPNGESYDRRHLVTTISHDDQFMRGVQVAVDDGTGGTVLNDIVDAMADVNLAADDPAVCDPAADPLVFEWMNYPHDVANGSIDMDAPCACGAPGALPGTPGPDLGACVFNVRKGRLKLSLPWLDDALQNGVITDGQRIRIIQDAFLIMLQNARGALPGFSTEIRIGVPPTTVPVTIPPSPDWDIGVTAAALTANLLDFMDADHEPTCVAVRSGNFENSDCAGRRYDDLDTAMPGVCVDAEVPDFVFGIEAQPYITEVAAHIEEDPNAPGEPNALTSAYAIELFNPYEFGWDPADPNAPAPPIPLSDYSIQVDGQPPRPLVPAGVSNIDISGGAYVVFENDPAGANAFGIGNTSHELESFTFEGGSVIYLLRDIGADCDYDGTTEPYTVVVDQFSVPAQLGQVPVAGGLPEVRSLERASVAKAPDIDPATGAVVSPWMAPLPADPANVAFLTHTLGLDADKVTPNQRPVEVNFANTGSFVTTDTTLAAFPTTGSLLLLMRHANLSIVNRQRVNALAFTAHLDSVKAQVINERNGMQNKMPITDLRFRIDNGRMPVFDDTPARGSLGGADRPDWLHHVDAGEAGGGDVGGVRHLPWGQLVFDYFTALPLSNDGPFFNPDDDENFVVAEAAQPRVDLDGLRVHGRLDPNVAPWKALSGVPFMPMGRMPVVFRDGIRAALGLDADDDGLAFTIGDDLAKAIVAYRETRAVVTTDPGTFTDATTGDFSALHGWTATAPRMRRGSGFLTVGELANVRHDAATRPVDPADPWLYRIDLGTLAQSDDASDPPRPDMSYIDAVATLVAMGDWLTVRSDVFTVYGTLRGAVDTDITDPDPIIKALLQAKDVDTRALRFQETVDRLPTLLGAPLPVPVGQRVVGRYLDTAGD